MKLLLHGDGGACLDEAVCAGLADQSRACPRATETDPQPEIIAQLAQEVYANDILQLLVLHIWRFEFEVRHSCEPSAYRGPRSSLVEPRCLADVGTKGCLSDLQQPPAKADWTTVADRRVLEPEGGDDLRCAQRVIRRAPSQVEMLILLLCRYENAEIALNTGMILREMLRHEALARTLLYSDKCVRLSRGRCKVMLTRVVHEGSITLSTTSSKRHLGSHAMRRPTSRHGRSSTPRALSPAYLSHMVSPMQETLTRHKPMVAEYLEANYDRVIPLLGAVASTD